MSRKTPIGILRLIIILAILATVVMVQVFIGLFSPNWIFLSGSAMIVVLALVNYIDKKGDVSKAKMARGGKKGGKPSRVMKAGIEKESGFLYYLDKNGDISRAKMAKPKKGKKVKKKMIKKKKAVKKVAKKKAVKKVAKKKVVKKVVKKVAKKKVVKKVAKKKPAKKVAKKKVAKKAKKKK